MTTTRPQRRWVEGPVTRGKVEELARDWAEDPASVVEVAHEGFNSDPVNGGFAFCADRGLMVYNVAGGCLLSVDPGDDAGRMATVEQWWRDTQHRNRPLSLDDVNARQRAAIAALTGGYESVADLPVGLLREIPDTAVADYLLVCLQRHVSEPTQAAALRALAANDWILEMPDDHGRAHPCPLCGRPAIGEPGQCISVCDTCYPRTTCAEGRIVSGYNTSFGGGFEAQHVDDGTVCEQVTRDGLVTVDAHECHMGEARFGGVFVGVTRSART